MNTLYLIFGIIGYPIITSMIGFNGFYKYFFYLGIFSINDMSSFALGCLISECTILSALYFTDQEYLAFYDEKIV